MSINTKHLEGRIDRVPVSLALIFTDLLRVIELLDVRLEHLERASLGQAERLAALQQQLAGKECEP